MLLWGLQQLINSNAPDMLLVGCATNSANALLALKAASADVILLDLDDEHMLDAIPLLMAESQARILAMTRQENNSIEDQAVLKGARGILGKNATPDIYLQAIVKVYQGQLWLDREATGRIFVEFSRHASAKSAAPEVSLIASLTEREKKIITCILENTGSSAKTLAEKLHISESTLRNHLTSIYGKLGVANRFELISFGLKNERALAFN